MVFEAPWDGADTDPDYNSPRSELRETWANGTKRNWDPDDDGGTHILDASCAVTDITSKVIIGQIHAATPDPDGPNGPAKPVPAVVLSYNYPSANSVRLTVKLNPYDEIADTDYAFSPVQPGQPITYQLKMVGSGSSLTLYATVNNDLTKVIPMTQSPYDPRWGTDATFYFKAGCYYPKNPGSGTAKVTFNSLTVTPQP